MAARIVATNTSTRDRALTQFVAATADTTITTSTAATASGFWLSATMPLGEIFGELIDTFETKIGLGDCQNGVRDD